MNNNMLIKMSVVCVLVLAARSNAHATAHAITATTAVGNSSFAPSANVEIDVEASNAAYAAFSQHLNGNRIYFGNNSDPKLYYNTKSPGTNTSQSVTATMTAPSAFSSL